MVTKMIKWLADVSGVTKKIEVAHCKLIGSYMYDYSYWFTGGLTHSKGINEVSNVLAMYSKALNKGNPTLIGSEHDILRNEIYRMSKNNILIHNT